MKHKLITLIAMAAALYLANIGGGVMLEVPDNMPLVGNADELLASGVLFLCLKYLKAGHAEL